LSITTTTSFAIDEARKNFVDRLQDKNKDDMATTEIKKVTCFIISDIFRIIFFFFYFKLTLKQTRHDFV